LKKAFAANPFFEDKYRGRRNAKVNKEIPYPFGIDEIRFKRCFSAPSYRIFAALLIGCTSQHLGHPNYPGCLRRTTTIGVGVTAFIVKLFGPTGAYGSPTQYN